MASAITRKRKNVPDISHSCKCKNHSLFIVDEAPTRTFSRASKDYSKPALRYLETTGLVSDRSKYFCNVCINFAKRKLGLLSESTDKNENTSIDQLDNKLKNVLLAAENMVEVSKTFLSLPSALS